MFSNTTYSNSGASFDYTSLFEFTTSFDYLVLPSAVNGIITIPEPVLQLGINTIYCSGVSIAERLYAKDVSIKYDIKLAEV